jgi:hypothetical protein
MGNTRTNSILQQLADSTRKGNECDPNWRQQASNPKCPDCSGCSSVTAGKLKVQRRGCFAVLPKSPTYVEKTQECNVQRMSIKITETHWLMDLLAWTVRDSSPGNEIYIPLFQNVQTNSGAPPPASY